MRTVDVMVTRERFRFRALFMALLVMYGVAPSLERGRLGANLLQLLFTIIFLSALNAVSERRGALVLGALLAVPAIIATWIGRIIPEAITLTGVGLVLATLFLFLTTSEIMRHILRARRVTTEIIFGALCIYILIGFIGALLFSTIELWQPGSLNLPAGAENALDDATRFSTISYYSFVTLTTLGYGDIAPVTGLARSLATFEAVAGQLFLAVLIARLVGLHIVHATKDSMTG